VLLLAAPAWLLLVPLSKLGWLKADCTPAIPAVLLLLLVHAASTAGSPAASCMLPLRKLITCGEGPLL
jgi:hypothetical protein